MSKQSVSTSELKVHCSKIIERVANGRGPVIITKRGRPVAQLIPITEDRPSLFGFAKGCITVNDDILAPIDVVWEAAE